MMNNNVKSLSHQQNLNKIQQIPNPLFINEIFYI